MHYCTFNYKLFPKNYRKMELSTQEKDLNNYNQKLSLALKILIFLLTSFFLRNYRKPELFT